MPIRIDFEGASGYLQTHQEDGFQLSSNLNFTDAYRGGQVAASLGTGDYFMTHYTSLTNILTRTDPGVFGARELQVDGFKWAGFDQWGNLVPGAIATTVTITGYRAGSSVTHTFVTDATLGFETVTLPPSFAGDLYALHWTASGGSGLLLFDNITVVKPIAIEFTGTSGLYGSYQEDGFELTSTAGISWAYQGGQHAGSLGTGEYFMTWGTSLTNMLTRTGGGTFGATEIKLEGFQYNGWNNGQPVPGAVATSVTFYGYKASGPVTYTFVTDGAVGFETVTLPSDFAGGLYELYWTATTGTTLILFDDIKVFENRPPVAADLSDSAPADQGYSGNVGAYDLDGEFLYYEVVGDLPAGAHLGWNGSVWVEPTEADLDLPIGQSRTVTFDYRVSDGEFYSATRTVTIELQGQVPPGQLIDGDADPNQLDGLGGPDTISGLAGEDTLAGMRGADQLLGGAGNDVLYGGASNDQLFGGDDDDELHGDDGDDSLSGDAGADFINGGEGVDTVQGGAGNDDVRGGEAGDSVSGGGGENILWGDWGDDTLSAEGDYDFAIGGEGNDLLLGGLGQSVLNGDEGDDVLIAGGGLNSLHGGAGNDTLTGGAGADAFRYEDPFDHGDDHIVGFDVLEDVIYCPELHASASDTLAAAQQVGDDVVITYLDDEQDAHTITLVDVDLGDLNLSNIFVPAGMTLVGDGDANELYGDDGLDSLAGMAGNDLLYGGRSADTLSGGDGDDELWGSTGADSLDGGAGLNTMYGGAGDDTLAGGSDADRFDFAYAQNHGDDVILNFDAAEDVIYCPGLHDSLADTLAAAQQVGSDVVITYLDAESVAHTITLVGVNLSSLSLSNFTDV